MPGADTQTRAVVLLTANGAERAICRIGPGQGRDLWVLESVLALSLAARREGMTIRLVEVDPDLAALCELLGVAGMLCL